MGGWKGVKRLGSEEMFPSTTAAAAAAAAAAVVYLLMETVLTQTTYRRS